MSNPTEYILGQSENAARRLELQDRHFAVPSEQLLDDLGIRLNDRVVELGCGPGGLTKRIISRLGAGGVVVAVDSSAGLLEQAAGYLAGAGPGRVEFVNADVSKLGSWLEGADVVVGRAVLHHVPMAEYTLGRLLAVLRPGTRVGFLEPDFRSPLARLAYLEAKEHPEYAPLRIWATAINDLYSIRKISPAVGATLGRTLETAGYRNVRTAWHEFPSDTMVIENMLMFYDEVGATLESYGILSAAQNAEQKGLLKALLPGPHPGIWGMFRAVCEV
jgi:ubiquinone/menaquinone biosynthesis C-methylase UbiE